VAAAAFEVKDAQRGHPLALASPVSPVTHWSNQTNPIRRDPRSIRLVGDVLTAITATYWDDVDTAWQRAVTAGAAVVYPLADQFYGERAGRLRDPFGQQWMLSRRIETVPAEEMTRRAAAFFHQSG
jgi:hypothetical protein